MRPSLLPLALLAAACLAHGADPAAPRRSLTVDLVPTTTRSDWDWCWDSLVTLTLCKHDLLASFFTGRPVPRACCHAADEACHHCGPFTRAFVGSLLLPRGPLAQCARTVIAGGAPTTLPSQRRAPPLETGTRVSGGARPPPAPEARTSARSPPPRAPTGASSGTQGAPEPKAETSARLPPPAPRAPSGTQGSPGPKAETSVRIPPSLLVPPKDPSGTHGSPGPKAETSVRIPPALLVPPKDPIGTQGSPVPKAETSARLPPPAPRAPSGTQGSPGPKAETSVRIPPSLLVPPKDPSGTQGSPEPKAETTARTPAVSGGARDGRPTNPKVIAGGSAGGRTRRAPDAYGPGVGAPLAAAAAPPPRKGARTARPSASGKGLPYGPPAE